METMENVIEEIKEVTPVEETQAALEVVTKKSMNKGGAIAAAVVLTIGAGFGIYKLGKKVAEVIVAKKHPELAESETKKSEED